MNHNIKLIYRIFMLIILIGAIYGQQVQFSRPMVAVKKHQPAYVIQINGKKLHPSVLNDIIRIEIFRKINSHGSLKIKLYNSENLSNALKYSKSSHFNRGDTIEIFLLKSKSEHPLSLTKGTVTSVDASHSQSDSSFLVIKGLSQKPDAAYPEEPQQTLYKIDSSNRNQFTLKRERSKDLVGVSMSYGNKIIGVPNIREGYYIQIHGIGELFNGTYYVSEVTHMFTTSGYRTHFKLKRNILGEE